MFPKSARGPEQEERSQEATIQQGAGQSQETSQEATIQQGAGQSGTDCSTGHVGAGMTGLLWTTCLRLYLEIGHHTNQMHQFS